MALSYLAFKRTKQSLAELWHAVMPVSLQPLWPSDKLKMCLHLLASTTLNPQNFICFSLPSTGIKGICHHMHYLFFKILWITNCFDCLISGRTQHYFCVRRSKTWVLHIHYTTLRLTKPFMIVFTCFPRLLTIYQKIDERETHADRDFDAFVCLYTHMNKFTPVYMCRA